MKRILHIFGRLLILLVFLGAAWLLYDRLKQYSLRQILDALADIPAWHIVVASLLTVLNYAILVGYDWFAVRWVGEKDLPLRKIALASFTGYAFSYNFGATLFGTSIRYRLYSAWGMSLRRILDLLVILGLTFWFGVFTLAGIVFMAKPFHIPKELQHELQHLNINIPFDQTLWLGALLLLLAVLYVAFAALRRKPLELFGWRIPLPPLKLTLYQIVIACGDLLVAALVLYTLLPPIDGRLPADSGRFHAGVRGGGADARAGRIRRVRRADHPLPPESPGGLGGGGAVGVPRDLLLGAAADCRGDAGLPRTDVGQR